MLNIYFPYVNWHIFVLAFHLEYSSISQPQSPDTQTLNRKIVSLRDTVVREMLPWFHTVRFWNCALTDGLSAWADKILALSFPCSSVECFKSRTVSLTYFMQNFNSRRAKMTDFICWNRCPLNAEKRKGSQAVFHSMCSTPSRRLWRGAHFRREEHNS